MLNPNVLLWIAITTPLLVTFGQWVDPDNAKTPWGWGRASRVATFVAVSLLAGGFSAITAAPGAPWTDTLRVALPTLVMSLVGHFAHGLLPETPASAAVKAARMRLATKTLAALALLGGLASIPSNAGCTPQARSAVTDALSYEQQACVWAEVVLPSVQEVKEACDLADKADQLVEAVMDDFAQHKGQIAAYLAARDRAAAAKTSWPPVTPEEAARRRAARAKVQ